MSHVVYYRLLEILVSKTCLVYYSYNYYVLDQITFPHQRAKEPSWNLGSKDLEDTKMAYEFGLLLMAFGY